VLLLDKIGTAEELGMRIASIRTGLPALALLMATASLAGGPGDPVLAAGPTGSEIFADVEQANAVRDSELQSYVSTRQYTVLEPGHPPDADLVISMQFVAPSTKTFGKSSEKGVGWIHKRVFHGLMKAEQQTAAGKEKADSALSPMNYSAQWVGDDRYQGRDCYVLALKPKREDKYLLAGKVWIDKGDLAIAKIEGDPVKSPSIWVERAHLVREYQRIGKFWLPLLDQTQCRIRFVGEYMLRISYFDYRITARD
jgi:hypothetical protein